MMNYIGELDTYLKVILAIVASLGGGGVIVIGLSTWLGKVWPDRILEQDRLRYNREIEGLRNSYQRDLERLKKQLQSLMFVHKAQIEAELLALQTVWTHVARMRTLVTELRFDHTFIFAPKPGTLDQFESRRYLHPESQNLLEGRIAALNPLIQELGVQMEQYKPFYPEDIYVDDCRYLCNRGE